MELLPSSINFSTFLQPFSFCSINRGTIFSRKLYAYRELFRHFWFPWSFLFLGILWPQREPIVSRRHFVLLILSRLFSSGWEGNRWSVRSSWNGNSTMVVRFFTGPERKKIWEQKKVSLISKSVMRNGGLVPVPLFLLKFISLSKRLKISK